MPRRLRKGRRKRGRARRRKSGSKAIARVARREIARAAETKIDTGFIASQGVTYSGSYWYLTTVSTGDTAYTRIGNEIQPKYYRLHCSINASTALASDVTNYVRLILIRMTRFVNPASSGTWPTFEEVLPRWQTTTDTLNLSTLMTASWPTDFKVIWDKTYRFDNTGPRTVFIRKKWKGKKAFANKIKWDVNQYQKGGLILYAYSDSTTAPHPNIAFDDRLYYKDM